MASREQLIQALKDSEAPLEDLSPKFKGMIYGESGVGKTVAALEIAQKISKVGILYIDAVEGWVSLSNHPELKKNVTRITYQGLSQLTLVADLFRTGDDWAQRFDTIVFDEISVIAQLDLDNVLLAAVKKDPTRDADVPTWPEMNANTHRLRKVTIEFGKLPLHQIYISHQREDEDKVKGYRIVRPEFMPKLSSTVRNILHLVGHMTATDKNVDGRPVYVRQIQVHPSKTIVAKSRIGGLGVHTTVSNLVDTIGKWTGGEVNEIERQDVIDDTSPAYLKDEDPVIEVN